MASPLSGRTATGAYISLSWKAPRKCSSPISAVRPNSPSAVVAPRNRPTPRGRAAANVVGVARVDRTKTRQARQDEGARRAERGAIEQVVEGKATRPVEDVLDVEAQAEKAGDDRPAENHALDVAGPPRKQGGDGGGQGNHGGDGGHMHCRLLVVALVVFERAVDEHARGEERSATRGQPAGARGSGATACYGQACRTAEQQARSGELEKRAAFRRRLPQPGRGARAVADCDRWLTF